MGLGWDNTREKTSLDGLELDRRSRAVPVEEHRPGQGALCIEGALCRLRPPNPSPRGGRKQGVEMGFRDAGKECPFLIPIVVNGSRGVNGVAPECR